MVAPTITLPTEHVLLHADPPVLGEFLEGHAVPVRLCVSISVLEALVGGSIQWAVADAGPTDDTLPHAIVLP